MNHGKSYKILRDFTAVVSGMQKVYFQYHTITEDLLLLTHTPAEIEWLIKLRYIE
jgi:hypothetical protein